MKKFKLFKMLAVLIVLITSVNTVWAYKIYFCTEYYTDWKKDSAKPKLFVTGFGGDSEMTNLSSNWWVCEVGDKTGNATIKRFNSSGTSQWNEFTVTGVDADNNIIFASSPTNGYKQSPREYDGKTYVYWRIHDNNIPDYWDDDDIDQDIQLRKNDNTLTGYVTGEKVDSKTWRYLVPEGKYVNAELRRHETGNYSGAFAFNASSSYNLIWDFNAGGHYANWSSTYFAVNAYVYMDNTSSEWSTNTGYNHILIGRAGTNIYSNTYHIIPIPNTNLLCYDGAFSFDDFNQICFIHTTADDWGESNSEAPGARKVHAANHTDEVAYMMDGGDSKNYHLYTPDGPGSGESYPSPAHASASTYGDLLHSTQRVYTVAKTTGSYSSVNSKAEITIESYYLDSETTSDEISATLTTSESTDNVTAVKTATTTLTCSNTIADGYQFDGWYESANGDDLLSDDDEYSYATTGATTVYARFSALSYTITLNDGSGSGGDGTHSVTYDAAVGSLSAAPTRTNYVFCGYETEGHVKIFNADLTAKSSVSGYTDASGHWILADDITLYAIWEDQWSIKGNGGILGDWSTYTGLPNTGTNTFGKTIELQKGTTYDLKIVNRNRLSASDTWYGNTNGSGLITITRDESGDAQTLATGGGEGDNIQITPDVTGNYVFSVDNSSGVKLTITYPASHTITFGAGTINGSSTAITASASPSFSSGDYVLDATSVTFSKGSTNAGYDWKGWYSNSDGTGTEYSTTDGNYTNSSRSGDMTVYACYTYHTFSITYKDQGNNAFSGTHIDSPSDHPTTHTYNTATTLNKAEKTRYVFEGWYTSSACTGDPVTSLGATAYTADITLYAKWTAAADYAEDCWVKGEYVCGDGSKFNTPAFDESASWTSATWGNSATPTINTQVVIPEKMTMTIPTGTAAVAKEVVLGKDAKLYVSSGGALIVASTIDKEGEATTSNVLTLSAGDDTYGNAALIWGEEGTSPGAATVDFYSKSHGQAGSTASVNQYIGVPTATSAYSYGDAWVCKIAYEENIAYWTLMDGSEIMSPWVGYDLILNTTNTGGLCTLSGTLEDNSDKDLSLHYYSSKKTENLLANSWPAPIKISEFEIGDFTNAEATIYIFNSTSPAAQTKDETMHMGSYSAYTAGTATEVIPSMQSFSVCATGSSASVSLNYKRLVYDPAVSSFSNHANYAPRRQERKEMNSLKVNVHDAEGWGDELKAFENADFTAEFEPGWDGHRLDGSSKAPHLYGLAEDGSELAVSCLPTFDNMPIGFRASAKAKTYTMSFQYEGEDELVLRDTKTNIETPIDEESTYEFVSESTDDDLRFVVIKKAPQITTAVDNISESNNVQKILHNGAFYIVREGRIYDATGALVK